MVSGYWQPNSVIILIFPTILLSSIQFCLSDLDSERNAIRFSNLDREKSYFDSIQRSSGENLRNDPIISNNRYSEHLQAENNKGSNFDEVRYQKIKSLRIIETGLNKINNLIRVSRNERYHQCSALRGISQNKFFSDSIENRRGTNQNALNFAEERQNRKLAQRRQGNRLTTEKEIERKLDFPRNENLRQVRRERSSTSHLLSKSESLERTLHEKEANRNVERSRRMQRNIAQLSAHEKGSIVSVIERARSLRMRESVLTDRRQFNRQTEDDMRNLRSFAANEELRMNNFGRHIVRNIPDKENNQILRRDSRIDVDRKMNNRRIEANKIFLRNSPRMENSLIEKRNNIRENFIENNLDARVLLERQEMIQRVQKHTYRIETRLPKEQTREKDFSNRQENDNLTNRERNHRDIREERETREDENVRRDTSARNLNRKREYENLMSREQNNRAIRKEQETRREERETRRQERETRREDRETRPEEREDYREEREIRQEDRETIHQRDNLQRDTSSRNMNRKREYVNLMSRKRNHQNIPKERETRREERETLRQERETLRQEREIRREDRETRREEREDYREERDEREIRQEDRETIHQRDSLQRDTSSRNMNRKREYENLMSRERTHRDIPKERETPREERDNLRQDSRREDRETNRRGDILQQDTSREYRNLMSRERSHRVIREERETRREVREDRDTRREDRENRREDRETHREERETRRENENLQRKTSTRNLNLRRETVRSNRRESLSQHECPASETPSQSMVNKNTETRNDRSTDRNISYLRNERHDSNNLGKNIWVNDNLLNQKPTTNIMLNLIQGLLIGAMALKAFSFQNSKNTIGVQLNSVIPLKCF